MLGRQVADLKAFGSGDSFGLPDNVDLIVLEQARPLARSPVSCACIQLVGGRA